MRVSRIFVEQALAVGAELQLNEKTSHYLGNVLRLKPGAKLILFDGSGCDYAAHLLSVKKKVAVVSIESKTDSPLALESKIHTEIAIGLSKGDKMDFVVQKCTELGVNIIQPLLTERVDYKLPADRQQKKVDHWRAVAIAACEQSGRAIVPEVREPVSFSNYLEQSSLSEDGSEKLALHFASDSLATHLATIKKSGKVKLLVGPEGGFSDDEISSAHKACFNAVSLGKRVLRTETAPLAALSLIQYS